MVGSNQYIRAQQRWDWWYNFYVTFRPRQAVRRHDLSNRKNNDPHKKKQPVNVVTSVTSSPAMFMPRNNSLSVKVAEPSSTSAEPVRFDE
jgi:hypothetical protein